MLDQALHMADPLGLVRTFVDRGSLMAELLQASVHHHPQDPYRHRLVQAFGGYHPSEGDTMALEADLDQGRHSRVGDRGHAIRALDESRDRGLEDAPGAPVE